MTERGIEQLHPKNHKLYLRVQTMLNMRCSFEHICDNLGLVGASRVNELCNWFNDYKSPKPMPLVHTGHATYRVGSRAGPAAHSERFIAWRRQREGARATLEALGL